MGGGGLVLIPSFTVEDLGEIDVTPNATASDWAGYPEGHDEHPARNHPAFTRELIRRYLPKVDEQDPNRHAVAPLAFWDPMAGAGTSLIEASREDLCVYGWDIEPKWRKLWKGLPFIGELEKPNPGMIGLIVTSPPFLGTNKRRGNTDRQREIQAKCKSKQGTEWMDLPSGHLGRGKTCGEWMVLARPVIEACRQALAPRGHLVWIVRDKIRMNAPIDFPYFNARLLHVLGFEILGAHTRRLERNNNYQLRAVEFREKYGRPPEWVRDEVAIVARRKR